MKESMQNIAQEPVYNIKKAVSPETRAIHDKVEAGRTAQEFLDEEKKREKEAKRLAQDLSNFYGSKLWTNFSEVQSNTNAEIIKPPINDILNWLSDVSVKAREIPGVNKQVMIILEELQRKAKKVKDIDFIQKRIGKMLADNPEYKENQNS